ncbi:MAG: hypothetical protein KF861_04830 [Planctomycetaceae bacterium]|nr:hypothetical protein [Planctomycetaceae bacterium]
MRRFPAYFLTVFYAGLSFLGHAGLHALDGTSHCHHHDHGVAVRPAECGHQHSPTHSCGDERHTHGAAAESDSAPAPEPESPPHDHDHCLICQWHAQGKTAVAALSWAALDAPGLDDLPVDATLPSQNDPLAARSRGPPLRG